MSAVACYASAIAGAVLGYAVAAILAASRQPVYAPRQKVHKVRNITNDWDGREVEYLACSGCGEWIDGDLDCIGEGDGPNFCGNCGGEFDGPLLCACGKLADLEFGGECVDCYFKGVV